MPSAKKPRTAADAISRLPRSARDEISRALQDGATWRTVARIAEKHGLKGVTAQNVSNYRHGAHKRWLEREERLLAIRRDSETTADIVRHYTQHGGSPAEAGILAAAELLSTAMVGLGPQQLAELIADEPKTFFRATRELARLTTLLDRRPLPEDSDQPPGPGEDLTPQERENAIRQIFGLPPA